MKQEIEKKSKLIPVDFETHEKIGAEIVKTEVSAIVVNNPNIEVGPEKINADDRKDLMRRIGKALSELPKSPKNDCPICKKSEFESLDYLRGRDLGFQVCRFCGFVTYKQTMTEEAFAKDLYVSAKTNPSRKFSGTKDLMTKQNKLSYHRAWLTEHLSSKKNLSVLDFGCSTGYFLEWCKQFGHTDLLGVELNTAHASYGRLEYGLDIREYYSPSEIKDKKFDVICLYHIIEHLIDPVQKLTEFKKLLKPGGIIYMSNPVWFEELKDASGMTHNFEGLYIPDHINVFSKISHENMIRLAGLKIVKDNFTYYGRTVILEVDDQPTDMIESEDYKIIMKKLSDQKKAYDWFFKVENPNDFVSKERNLVEALKCYSKFPQPFIELALGIYKDDFDKQVEIFREGIKQCPNSAELFLKLGTVLLQHGHSRDGAEHIAKCYEMKPTMIYSLFLLAEIKEIGKEYAEAIKLYKKILESNPSLIYSPFMSEQETVLDRIGVCYAKIGIAESSKS